ncbi:MAG: hypothetical protein GY943_11810 [Chloroflexi bacterium]|nr:hypothetical protein [Chloroflexota bacterium]
MTALLNSPKRAGFIRLGQDELITYRVDLRRKLGSKVASGMWGTLEKRLEERQTRRKK